MNARPTTFADLIRRLVPDSPEDAYCCPPLVASAVELDRSPGRKGRRFWVILYSVSEEGVKLFHAKPVRARSLAIRIQAKSGEVVQAIVTVADSNPQGDLYATTAKFQRVGLDVRQLI